MHYIELNLNKDINYINYQHKGVKMGNRSSSKLARALVDNDMQAAEKIYEINKKNIKPFEFITKSKKKTNTDGTIDFINGSKMFLNDSIYNHKPKVGDVLLFPNYLMHTAYPFSSEGERRSFSFNLEIDKNIDNVFTK